MIDSKKIEVLKKTINFLVSENRNSALASKDRLEIQNKKRFGKILGFLYPFGFWGGIIYCLSALWKGETVTMFRDMIFEDHASKVVHNSLKRTWGENYDQDKSNLPLSRLKVLITLLKNIFIVRRAYKSVKIDHVTEFVRVFRLVHFYFMWKALFSSNPPASVLFVRTNDPKRLALGTVAEEYEIPSIAFTVDRVALRKPAPFAIDTLLCWTMNQKKLAEERNIPVIRMPVPSIKAIKLPVPNSNSGVYGLLLNAKCDPLMVAKWVEEISSMYNISSLQVRPHPGYAVEKLSIIPHSVICDWHQPLEEYLDGLDLVFALNTNSIIDALLHGVPVVYVGGLDPYDYDLHRFVADGIVFPYSPENSSIKSIIMFYSSEPFKEMWNPKEFITDNTEEYDVLTQLTGAMNDNIVKT